MIKAKKTENKKASPAKAGKANAEKFKKIAKKSPPAKQIKGKKDAKVKKAIKGGLVKPPLGGSPKVKSPKDETGKSAEKVAAIREKRKQKKLEKKLKKVAAKKQNGVKASDIDSETPEKSQQNNSEEESSETETPTKSSKKLTVKPAKKAETEAEEATRKEKTQAQTNPKQTVFVGNLPSNTKRVQLVKLFNKFGKIMCVRFRTASGKVIFKHKARKEANSLNGYVVFDNEESAAQALELNNFEFKGHHLRVTPTEPEAQQRDPKRTIVVGNLKYTATDEKLHEIFSSCGEIEYVRTIQNGDKGCNGVGFVCFKSPDAVGLALELKGTVVDERPINVERYKTTKTGAKLKRDQEEGSKNAPKAKGGPNKYKMNKKDAGAKVPANGKKAGGSPKKPAGQDKGKMAKKPGKDGGKAKKAGNPPKNKKEPSAEGAEPKKSKPEYRGVKSTIVKKKQKKVPNAMKKLAMKIAPKGDN